MLFEGDLLATISSLSEFLKVFFSFGGACTEIYVLSLLAKGFSKLLSFLGHAFQQVVKAKMI